MPIGQIQTEADLRAFIRRELGAAPEQITSLGSKAVGLDGALSAHEADTTAVHGIADTAALYRAGGADVAVADGGTGSSTAAAARAALGTDAAGAQRPPSSSGEATLKVLRGVIEVTAATATVIQGAGFTVTRNGSGDVTINFTTAFGSPPAVVATPIRTWAAAADARQCQFHTDPTANAARVYILDNAGNFQVGRLCFVAWAPA